LVDAAFENLMLVCATELQSKATIDEFVALLSQS
jgi:hypothetical protein